MFHKFGAPVNIALPAVEATVLFAVPNDIDILGLTGLVDHPL